MYILQKKLSGLMLMINCHDLRDQQLQKGTNGRISDSVKVQFVPFRPIQLDQMNVGYLEAANKNRTSDTSFVPKPDY